MPALESLGIALLLGLLVGLQRERTDSHLAGIRTFALITVLGAMSALLSLQFGGWVMGGALVAIAAAVVIGNVAALKAGVDARGITSEIAIFVMFGVGALLVPGPKVVAVVVGVATALVLHSKPVLHGFTKKLGDEDVRAIMRFALISCIILPVIPDQTYGPFNVVNPHQVWLMVVLVVGLSLGAYIAYKFLGKSAGLILGGLLGGLISSTATTVSHARRSKSASPGQMRAAVFVILLATAVLHIRLLVEISVAAPGHTGRMLPPVIALTTLAFALAAISWRTAARDSDPLPTQENPTQMRTALVFAGMYAVVTLAVAAAEHYLGDSGTYVVAVVSGITDMDAITLSTSGLAAGDKLSPDSAWRSVLIASVSNLTFKFIVAWSLGGRPLAKRLAPYFGALAVGAVAIVLFWPAAQA